MGAVSSLAGILQGRRGSPRSATWGFAKHARKTRVPVVGTNCGNVDRVSARAAVEFAADVELSGGHVPLRTFPARRTCARWHLFRPTLSPGPIIAEGWLSIDTPRPII